MEVKHAIYGDEYPPNEMVTFQLLKLCCPKCKEPVQYAIQDDDRLYREDAKFWEKKCFQLSKEIKRLNETIDLIVKANKLKDQLERKA